ncbi:MAG: dicarboxylate/amino acid:cation symporter [Vicinamibacteria bacterium]|nr:dicarboxylate/amino acid:cation symporter [Vicinamibacteria bacterium]
MLRLPLYARVLIGVALGTFCGLAFGEGTILFGLTNKHLGDAGLLVIRLLRAMAVPLIFFAVVDAFVRTEISGKQGLKLVAICAFNVSVAFLIGMTLINTFRPGEAWKDRLADIEATAGGPARKAPEGLSLDPMKNLSGYVPANLVDPFQKDNGNVISVVFLAIMIGVSMRRLIARQGRDSSVARLADLAEGGFDTLVTILGMIVEAIPFAVFGVLAQVIGRDGTKVFGELSVYVVAMVSGLSLHALGYYTLAAWLIGRRAPRVYFGEGAPAIFAGMSMNSSLATVPLTLESLKRMKISDASARLSACVGTNLNNDGIVLYDAMAALFLSQALGYDLTFSQQAVVALASLMAGIGISGVPDAGLIVLPLVLSTVGLPEAVIVGVIPVLFSVDWLIGRVRSGVNVMSDMLVAILLDRSPAEPSASGGAERAA